MSWGGQDQSAPWVFRPFPSEDVEEFLDVAPQVDPDSEDQSGGHGEEDGDQHVDEEGEEGPEHEGQADDQDRQEVLKRYSKILGLIYTMITNRIPD